MKKECLQCKKLFEIKYKSWANKKFCNKICKSNSQKNKKLTQKQKEALAKGRAWNKGLKGLQPWHNISGLRPPRKGERLGVLTEEKNPNWKGDNVGYYALHDWVARYKGKANQCIHCKSTNSTRYEWANVSGKYKRDLDDYISLCKKCHNNFDGVNIWQQKSKK
jgi:hypothetical protein